MKTAATQYRLGLLFIASLLLSGCASYEARIEKGHDLAQNKYFFIIHNPSDNHALDHRIAEALQARGLKVEMGPLTMMPENTQAVIVYQDRWGWDFGEHLVYLQIDAREPQKSQAFASASLVTTIPLRESSTVSVNRLIDRLFAGKKS
ncbi:MAG: hypothetical protein EBT98_06870 [Opitutaceae bacterium]|jgi:hypothetical protein|nr:hypothetical protein [Opitutaceae bacterium]NBR59518.1 hypothetical protein [Opitutaceae bacterium]